MLCIGQGVKNMKIHGLTKTTLLDYPGRVAATIFLGGCNFRCPFCHNGDLVLHCDAMETYDEEEVLGFLKKRKNVLEGVCITGGEPTLYKELPDFIKRIKNLGYLVKLDTNGSYPEMLEELIEKEWVDYVAMDIKAPLCKYDAVCGVLADMEKIQRSVALLLEEKVDYEFRTTLVKEFHSMEDVCKIGDWILGAKNYYLQNYQETDKNIRKGFHPLEKDELLLFREALLKRGVNATLRGIG